VKNRNLIQLFTNQKTKVFRKGAVFFVLRCVDMRGMVLDRISPAPTKGYFEYAPNGTSSYYFGSGALN
jgi:hypothetical protein